MSEGREPSWQVKENRTRLKLKPGQDGTKKLLAQYGEQLVCVRYRYDDEKRKRYKTVELIVDEAPWNPKFKGNELVGVRVELGEAHLRMRVKQAGGVWDGSRKVWRLRYNQGVGLGLGEGGTGRLDEVVL
jgi:hypothetical protein